MLKGSMILQNSWKLHNSPKQVKLRQKWQISRSSEEKKLAMKTTLYQMKPSSIPESAEPIWFSLSSLIATQYYFVPNIHTFPFTTKNGEFDRRLFSVHFRRHSLPYIFPWREHWTACLELKCTPSITDGMITSFVRIPLPPWNVCGILSAGAATPGWAYDWTSCLRKTRASESLPDTSHRYIIERSAFRSLCFSSGFVGMASRFSLADTDEDRFLCQHSCQFGIPGLTGSIWDTAVSPSLSSSVLGDFV